MQNTHSSHHASPRINAALKDQLVRPIGCTVYLMPPYILSDAEIDLLATRLHTVFDEVLRT